MDRGDTAPLESSSPSSDNNDDNDTYIHVYVCIDTYVHTSKRLSASNIHIYKYLVPLGHLQHPQTHHQIHPYWEDWPGFLPFQYPVEDIYPLPFVLPSVWVIYICVYIWIRIYKYVSVFMRIDSYKSIR
jgi:hypothetical protein